MSENLERFIENSDKIKIDDLRFLAEEIKRLRAEVRALKEENADLKFGIALLRENGQLPLGQG